MTRSRYAQPRNHGFGLRRPLLLDQDHDGAKHVVEEMRLQLHLERAQLRGGQLPCQVGGMRRELERLPFTQPCFLVRSVDRLDRHDRPVLDHAALNAERDEHPHPLANGTRGSLRGKDAERHPGSAHYDGR